jgi:hypothetical protein
MSGEFPFPLYVPPSLVEVGDFTRLTLGGGWVGFDNFWLTEW